MLMYWSNKLFFILLPPWRIIKKGFQRIALKCFFLIKIKPALSERYFKQKKTLSWAWNIQFPCQRKKPGEYRTNEKEQKKEGEDLSQLLCLKHDCLTNFQNTIDLSNVHTRSVRFLKGWEREGGGRPAVWKHNFGIRENGKNVGHNIFSKPIKKPLKTSEPYRGLSTPQAGWCISRF